MSKREISFNLNPKLYIKDPQSSDYGKRLIEHSIIMFDKLGFESFTFKKLASSLSSTEASVYRYFQNKHLLLLFLECWYWEWVNYLIDIQIMNIKDPKEKLKITLHQIANASSETSAICFINIKTLNRVIIKEGAKAYHVHNIDSENQDGLFGSYKELVEKVVSIIQEVNPTFLYPKMLASNLFEMSKNQIYFAEHLPRLTDIKDGEDKYDQLEMALRHFSFRLLNI